MHRLYFNRRILAMSVVTNEIIAIGSKAITDS
jgi:hypothetical protein